MGRNMIESVMGGVVLMVAALFVFFGYEMADVEAVRGYEVQAVFSRIGGLARGSDVRVSGIKVGTVVDHALDPVTFDAVVTLSISPEFKLPSDTKASITSEGLLGEKYVRLEPGTTGEMIADGGEITDTYDYKSLEDQVGEIIFLATGGSGLN